MEKQLREAENAWIQRAEKKEEGRTLFSRSFERQCFPTAGIL